METTGRNQSVTGNEDNRQGSSGTGNDDFKKVTSFCFLLIAYCLLELPAWFVSNYAIYCRRSIQSNRLFFRRSFKKFLNL
jgi:hypothetical protein